MKALCILFIVISSSLCFAGDSKKSVTECSCDQVSCDDQTEPACYAECVSPEKAKCTCASKCKWVVSREMLAGKNECKCSKW